MIIAVFGSSGSGKTYLLNEAISGRFPLKKIAAVTTRPMRSGIDECQERIFVDNNQFNNELEKGNLCLVNEVYGYRYAYYKKDLLEGNIILEAHFREYAELKNTGSGLYSICVLTESAEAAYEHVKTRNTVEIDRWEEIHRENKILNDMAECQYFDYVIINNYTSAGRDTFLEIIDEIMRNLRR